MTERFVNKGNSGEKKINGCTGKRKKNRALALQNIEENQTQNETRGHNEAEPESSQRNVVADK